MKQQKQKRQKNEIKNDGIEEKEIYMGGVEISEIEKSNYFETKAHYSYFL